MQFFMKNCDSAFSHFSTLAWTIYHTCLMISSLFARILKNSEHLINNHPTYSLNIRPGLNDRISSMIVYPKAGYRDLQHTALRYERGISMCDNYCISCFSCTFLALRLIAINCISHFALFLTYSCISHFSHIAFFAKKL